MATDLKSSFSNNSSSYGAVQSDKKIVKFIDDLPVGNHLEKKSAVAYKKNDLVEHGIFGEGVIIRVEQKTLTIAFAAPHGIKKILATHAALHKKER